MRPPSSLYKTGKSRFLRCPYLYMYALKMEHQYPPKHWCLFCGTVSWEAPVLVFTTVKATVVSFVISSEKAAMCPAGCRYRWGRSPFTVWEERVWSSNIFTALRLHRIHLITYECYCIVGRPWAYSVHTARNNLLLCVKLFKWTYNWEVVFLCIFVSKIKERIFNSVMYAKSIR